MATGRLSAGSVVKNRELLTIQSKLIQVPDEHWIVHLQFRRFAGCPVCDLHLHQIARRHDAIVDASIKEVVVFHTDRRELLRYASDLPFAVIADPDRQLYLEFGVEAGPRALLHPRSWVPIARGVLRSMQSIFQGKPVPPVNPQGGRFGLPADFLIASDGRILASKYGSHAYDQWSVDELLALSSFHTREETSSDALT